MTEQQAAEIDRHDFDSGHTGMSERCNALVMRNGTADICEKPRIHLAHGLDPWCRFCYPEGHSVYEPCAAHGQGQSDA